MVLRQLGTSPSPQKKIQFKDINVTVCNIFRTNVFKGLISCKNLVSWHKKAAHAGHRLAPQELWARAAMFIPPQCIAWSIPHMATKHLATLLPITNWRQNENNSLTWCPHVYSTKCKSASKLTNVEHVMNMYTFSGVCFAKKGFSFLFLYSPVFCDQWRYQLWLRPLWLCLSCRSLSLGIYVIRSTLYGFKFSYNQPIIAIFKLRFTEYLSCIIQNY